MSSNCSPRDQQSKKNTTSHSSVGNISCLPDLTKIAEIPTHCPRLYSPSEQLEQYMFLKASKARGSLSSSVNLCQGCLFPSHREFLLLFTSCQCLTSAASLMFFQFPPYYLEPVQFMPVTGLLYLLLTPCYVKKILLCLYKVYLQPNPPLQSVLKYTQLYFGHESKGIQSPGSPSASALLLTLQIWTKQQNCISLPETSTRYGLDGSSFLTAHQKAISWQQLSDLTIWAGCKPMIPIWRDYYRSLCTCHPSPWNFFR